MCTSKTPKLPFTTSVVNKTQLIYLEFEINDVVYFRWYRFSQNATTYTRMRKTDASIEVTWERPNIRAYSIINLLLLYSHIFLFFPPQHPSKSPTPHNPFFSLKYFAGRLYVAFAVGQKEQGTSELCGTLCTWRQRTTRPVPGVDDIRVH